jgi:tripartite-type tricarboxylate transporter receptor subunit TctC
MQRFTLRTLVAALALAVSGSGLAQTWPAKPVRVIVPFAAGGNTDGIARIASERLTSALGQQFVVENRPGAGGAIAADLVAKSAPDGYTLFVSALGQLAILPFITKVGYDPIRDFEPVSNIGENAFILGVHQSVPVRTVRELVDFVKANPGKTSYASGGSGSVSHLSAALFVTRAGIDVTHVPYKGGAPAVADLVGGQVQMYFGNYSDMVPHAQAGKVRLLGISSLKRDPRLPDVPTIAESGYPDFRTVTWNGLVAPAKTPKEIIERLSAELQKAAKEPAYVERLQKLGVDSVGSTPEQFARTIRQDVTFWGNAAKAANVKMD